MKMNIFEKIFFSSVLSIIINFMFNCILFWPLIELLWALGSKLNFSKFTEASMVTMTIQFLAFFIPWSMYNIYRYHIWKKFQKSKVIYICTLVIPSFCISLIVIIIHIADYIRNGPGPHSFMI